MNVPSLPFDSLYKFTAFSGIILIVAGCFIATYNIDTLLEKNHAAEIEAIKLEHETDIFLKQQRALEKEFENVESVYKVESDAKGSEENNRPHNFLKANLPRVREMFTENRNLSNKIKINRKLVGKEVDRNSSLYKNSVLIFISCLGFVIVGVFLSAKGFELWYEKIQVFDDIVSYKDYKEKNVKSVVCQSCGRDLYYFKNHRGKEKNGETSNIFCSTCYEDGELIEPEITLVQMQEKVNHELNLIGCDKKKKNVILKKLTQLERWRNQY